jgi:hypothetical protein
MVKCNCGKDMEHLPNWLEGVTVNVVCNNCPNRELRNISEIRLDENGNEIRPEKK